MARKMKKIKVMKFTSQGDSSVYLEGKHIAGTRRDWMAGTYPWFVTDSEGWRHEGFEDMPEFALDEVLRLLRQLYPDHEILVDAGEDDGDEGSLDEFPFQ